MSADDFPTQRQRYMKRLAVLRLERSTWIPHWEECSKFLLPWHWRYFQGDRNKGWKRNDHIINNTPLLALRTLASGMMAGLTSPARPWFRLLTGVPELDESPRVRAWCAEVESRARLVLARSNIYRALGNKYLELGAFGTSATVLDEDDHTLIRARNVPLGQFCLANGARQSVDSFYREFSMTAAQVVERFGIDKASQVVKEAVKPGSNRDLWVDILQVIEPNTDYEPDRAGPRGMRWRSIYLELAARDQSDVGGGVAQNGSPATQFLEEGGYNSFPVLAARWNVTGEDVYGFSPGIEALGDAKALQQLERMKLKLAGKIGNPPMLAPAAFRSQRISLLEGDVTYGDEMTNGQSVRPLVVIPPQAIEVLGGEILRHERRSKQGLYADLWAMFSQMTEGSPITAREVAERHEEKMLLLGPALESIEGEVLDPLIARLLDVMERRGMLPPPPPELQGLPIRPEYTSIMAQAQKLIGISNEERLVGFAQTVAQIKPEVLDNFDQDEAFRDYADRVGANPKVLVDPDKVAQIRADRAKQQQAQAMGQSAQVAGKAAKDLSGADMSTDNGLTRLLSGLGPAAQAAGAVQ